MFAKFIAALPVLSALVVALPQPQTAPQDGQNDGVALHPGGHNSICLSIRGDLKNGTPVGVTDCSMAEASKAMWVINRGSTKVRLAGSNFCLDASYNTKRNTNMKIWECIDNSKEQAWWWTDDDHIALAGRPDPGLCLDMKDGSLSPTSSRAQVYDCISYNKNQIWTSSEILE